VAQALGDPAVSCFVIGGVLERGKEDAIDFFLDEASAQCFRFFDRQNGKRSVLLFDTFASANY